MIIIQINYVHNSVVFIWRKKATTMINPFCPNGISSLKIIYNLAKKEFGDSIKTPNSFSSIKKDITNALRKMNPKEREENKLDTLVGIEHIKQNDFGNFMTLRFAYWGMLIAIAVAIMGNIQIYEYFIFFLLSR